MHLLHVINILTFRIQLMYYFDDIFGLELTYVISRHLAIR
jgi:hypothetical protein